ncbi:MAG: rhodanese-like domain-containing protein [Bdellovibrionaceae bacterium]|nr:rhodanese-like domain-containing protein [Pseudobdellovibrionaceae bacterium]
MKSFFVFLRQSFFNKKESKSKLLEDDLYSLDKYQLNNLIEKNISFDFFQLESFSEDTKSSFNKYLQKARLQTKEDILSDLNQEDVKTPIILICKTGKSSQTFSRQLRDKGFVNVYFIKKGLESLVEDF